MDSKIDNHIIYEKLCMLWRCYDSDSPHNLQWEQFINKLDIGLEAIPDRNFIITQISYQ